MYEKLHPHPIAGVDEVGRGAIAGPVVACAVVLPEGLYIEGIYDSKKLSKFKREELSKKIAKTALCFSYGLVEAGRVDEINIHRASLEAMKNAVDGLSVKPRTVLLDGTHPPAVDFPVVCIKGGDSLSFTIAAASILAKVFRDGLMEEYHDEYPCYGFSSHKGYGTKKHFDAVSKHGFSPLHRKTFLKKYE